MLKTLKKEINHLSGIKEMRILCGVIALLGVGEGKTLEKEGRVDEVLKYVPHFEEKHQIKELLRALHPIEINTVIVRDINNKIIKNENGEYLKRVRFYYQGSYWFMEEKFYELMNPAINYLGQKDEQVGRYILEDKLGDNTLHIEKIEFVRTEWNNVKLRCYYNLVCRTGIGEEVTHQIRLSKML